MRKPSDSDLYHVNPATGNPGLCKAVYSCPFGGDEAHFDNEASARAMFENTQESFPKLAKKAKVFRIGSLEPQEKHFDDLQGLLKDFEETTPEGRVGRANGLFASPDIQSHGRWVLGIGGFGGSKGDVTSHEISVNPNEVYVYPIDLYEKASSVQRRGAGPEFREAAKEYWEAGLTLAEWQSWAAQAKPDPGTWEVLVPPSAVQNPRPVSNRRIIENSDERWYSELNWQLERSRTSKGLKWERKPSS